MTTLGRQNVPTSTNLVLRILERPGLVAAVRELPGAVLGALIQRIGLEDAGELVALASREQLERIFDDDLWRAERPGGDETFRPERFALWLRVMMEAGDDAVVGRLCEMPVELVALGVHRLVLVLDSEVFDEQLSPGDQLAQDLERALEDSAFEEWEELRLIARDPDAWEDVWSALVLLDRDHHDRLRAILESCRDMSMEYISGQGGLFQVLTADEMLESDVAASREDRRGAEGFVSPADARAFLESVRREGGAGGHAHNERDPITRAYFRGLATPAVAAGRRGPVAARSSGAATSAGEPPVKPVDARDLEALLREAEVMAPAPTGAPLLAALGGEAAQVGSAHLVAPLFERAMGDLRQRDPDRFAERLQELGYLVNVWIAGGATAARRPRPVEALEKVLAACEAGMRAQLGPTAADADDALAVLVRWPADILFRHGMREADRDPEAAAAKQDSPYETPGDG